MSGSNPVRAVCIELELEPAFHQFIFMVSHSHASPHAIVPAFCLFAWVCGEARSSFLCTTSISLSCAQKLPHASHVTSPNTTITATTTNTTTTTTTTTTTAAAVAAATTTDTHTGDSIQHGAAWPGGLRPRGDGLRRRAAPGLGSGRP